MLCSVRHVTHSRAVRPRADRRRGHRALVPARRVQRHTGSTSQWHDERFTGKRFDDLLVIAIDDSTSDRRLFEDTFSRALR